MAVPDAPTDPGVSGVPEVPTVPRTPGTPGVVDEGRVQTERILAYPFARREMIKESIFLAFPFVGAFVGLLYIPWRGYPPFMHLLGGVMCGYLAGGIRVTSSSCTSRLRSSMG